MARMKMKIPPHVNMLRQYRAERTNYLSLVCEGIDNGFDANAQFVQVRFAEDEILFRDDGMGITKDHLSSVFSIGEHGAMNSTKLGQFGIGIKAQAINAGNCFEVISDSTDGHVRASAEWLKILETDWEIDLPVWSRLGIVGKTGTTIRISDLRRKPDFDLDKIIEGVALRFYPAIAGGRRIVINGRKVPLLPDPEMSDVIDCKLTFSGGRSATLHAGMLIDPAKSSKLSKVHVGYAHRIIMPHSAVGCGEYGGGAGKMFARLQLYGNWQLSRFKDDLPDDDERDELDNAVLEKLEEILKQCRTQHRSARIKEMMAAINERLPEELRAVRPPRAVNRQNRKGQKFGQGGGKTESEQEKAGPAQRLRRQPRLLITFDGNCDQDGIGRFDGTGRPYRVDLAADHLQIAMLADHQDKKMADDQVLLIALLIYHEGEQWLHAQRETDELSFGKQVANTFGMQDESRLESANES